MTPCTTPAESGDTRYVYGLPCTWHGPIAAAAADFDMKPCCPHCGCSLAELPGEGAFWEMVRVGDRLNPGYEALMHWAQGRCFSDGETLENAYRQAMEGQD